MKIVTIIGARPQIIKAAALSRAIKEHFSKSIQEVIVHTGQHYDDNMSRVFFEELSIPQPEYNLQVGSGNHGVQTAKMIEGIEEILLKEKADCLVVYGDTNSTIAGSLAAAKLHVPIAHIEAGLRSFNKKMPEEINRIACDHMSTFLYSPTLSGIENLKREGFEIGNTKEVSIDHPRVAHVGDVMYDNSLHFSKLSDQRSTIIKQLGLSDYCLCTVHRNDNTDQPEKLKDIFSALLQIAEQENETIVLPLHPRTRKMMQQLLDSDFCKRIEQHPRIKIIPPASFLDIIALEKNAKMLITDSGGMQKEAYFFNKPCIILRPQTEWVEIIASGNAIIADTNKLDIVKAYKHYNQAKELNFEPLYGNGNAAFEILTDIQKHLS